MTKGGRVPVFPSQCDPGRGFYKLRHGDEVYYIEDVGDTGPMATKVWVKGR